MNSIIPPRKQVGFIFCARKTQCYLKLTLFTFRCLQYFCLLLIGVSILFFVGVGFAC